jgi:hypothetical protein
MTPRSSDIPPPEAASARALKIPKDVRLFQNFSFGEGL